MSKNRLFVRFLIWRARKIPDNSFVLFLGVIIGFSAGLAAALLKFVVIISLFGICNPEPLSIRISNQG